jgi:transposase-like protein
MKHGCPNLHCNFHKKKDHIIKDGSYKRANDSRRIQRYKCKNCVKYFSTETFSLANGQKKRRVNNPLFKLLASGVSMRRCAKLLNIHRKTVARKLVYLSLKAEQEQEKLLTSLEGSPISHMQFDDLITTEHTKLKPLSVTLAVDAQKRTILGVEVSQIPSFGLLAEISRKKYGKRPSFHAEGIDKLFKKIFSAISKDALIESDEHKTYPKYVNKYFKQSEYIRYKGGRGCVVGQGELKKLYHDPLFALNHTCAMLRANINRLIRKTWCTTKDPEMLKHHLNVYMHYHNTQILG